MPLFVDHVGLNTLVSEELSTDANSTLPTNTRGTYVTRGENEDLRNSSLRVSETETNNPYLTSTSVTGWPTSGALMFSFWINLDDITNNNVTRYVFYGKSFTAYSHLIFFHDGSINFVAKPEGLYHKRWSFTIDMNSLLDTWNFITISWTGDFADDPLVFLNDEDSELSLYDIQGIATGTTYRAPDGYTFFDHDAANPIYELSGRLQSFTIYSDASILNLPDRADLYNSGVVPDYNSIEPSYLLEYWLFGNEPEFSSVLHGSPIGIGSTIRSTGGSIGTSLTSPTNEVILSQGNETYSPQPYTYDQFVARVSNGAEFAALNTHRNGPYGYSSWKQLRASENPITRHHKANSTMTFVVQPGPMRNVLSNGELRVRDRYSALYTFTEPAIAQKAYPLVWNVGKHFKDENGNVDLENPERFSIISSYANQGIGFANDEVDKLHKFDPDEEKTEYREIYKLYAEGGLNDQASPLTYWEFLQYRETVFPHMKNQFQNENVERPRFESFYRHNRIDRQRTFVTNSFGFTGYHLSSNPPPNLTQSTWPLDAPENFLTRDLDTDGADSLISGNRDKTGLSSNIVVGASIGGAGVLQANYSSFFARNANVNPIKGDADSTLSLILSVQPGRFLSPLPVYSRPTTLSSTQSVSNPCGMEIPETSSANYHSYHPTWTLSKIYSGSFPQYEDLQYPSSSWHNVHHKLQITDASGTELDSMFMTSSINRSANTFNRTGPKQYEIQLSGAVSYDGTYLGYRQVDLRAVIYNAVNDCAAQDGFGVSSSIFVASYDQSDGFFLSFYGISASNGDQIKFIPDYTTNNNEIKTDFTSRSIRRTALSASGCYTFAGDALWQAGSTREVKDESGNYISAPKTPFYDTYEGYIEEARRRYKNFSVVPEFRMSTQVADYLANGSAIELDMFQITGGVEGAEDSSKSQFYEIYSNSDFMRQFELINEDHREFTNGKVLSLRCKAVKKFLPYEGFYPAQRAVDLSEQFYKTYKDSISSEFEGNFVIDSSATANYGIYPIMKTLFSPGILFNSIKSGIAVDYPIADSSEDIEIPTPSNNEFVYRGLFSQRIPFEALVEPQTHLVGTRIRHPEPHPSGTFPFASTMNATSDFDYVKMSNNFLAESINFFLPNGETTKLVSKKQGGGIQLTSGSVYGMRIKMARSMTGSRESVVTGSDERQRYFAPQDIPNGDYRETFTMYSRPSAFGLPTYGSTSFSAVPNITETDRYDLHGTSLIKDSRHGYNFPFTPPYYHGEAWCDIVLTATKESYTIKEIQEEATYTYSRFDYEHYLYNDGAVTLSSDTGAQGFENINDQALQLSSSVILDGVLRDPKERNSQIVESSLDSLDRWAISPKFETPMFNFNHLSSEQISIPLNGSESVPRGMWHQYGRVPEENEGVFMSVSKIPYEYQIYRNGQSEEIGDLSEILGFSGQQVKLGRTRTQKTIYEAVVAVPFIENEGKKKFFRLDAGQVAKYKAGGEERASLTSGDPQTQIGRSVLNQMQKMEKYIFPPSFDFLNFEDVDPIAMYIFEFSHTLNQQDLADIWQNLPPDIGTTMEESEVAITHPLLKKELLGEGGGQSGNILIDMPNKLKWMVFKVKQRAASNYFKKTVLRNPEVNTDVESGNVTQDEFGATSNIQYNWPYDFFSLVELVKLDAEVEFGNFDESDIANYTDSIPPYQGQSADMEKIEYIVGGMEDDIVPDVQVEEEYEEESVDVSTPTSIPEASDDSEGIFDVPSFVPQAVARNYVIAKGRFSVELEKSPTLSYAQVLDILNDVIYEDMSIIGDYPAEGRPGTVFNAWSEWAQSWHDENSVEPLGLGGGGKTPDTEFQNFKAQIRDFIEFRMQEADDRSRRVQKRMLRRAKKAAKRDFEYGIQKYPNLEKYIDNYKWGYLV
jgi:hypothetical protein